jgi:Methyltransferase small domain
MAFQLWAKGDLRRDEPHTGQGTLYPTSNMFDGIRTFADLGCNVGYFTCWLCHQLKSTQLKGLMVDAHADAIEDARWHVATNNLRNVHVLHGLVGTRGKGASEFFRACFKCCFNRNPAGYFLE